MRDLAEETAREKSVGCGKHAGDAGRVVEAVCPWGGGDDCAWLGAACLGTFRGRGRFDEELGDFGVDVEVAGCEGPVAVMKLWGFGEGFEQFD